MAQTPLDTPTTKDELLAQIKSEFADFVALVEQIPADQRTTPIAGDLTVKDIVAHITDWEAWMLLRLRSAAVGEYLPARVAAAAPDAGADAPASEIDSINAQIYELYKDADWHTVWEDLLRTHEESMAELELLSDKDLFDPNRSLQVAGFEGEAVFGLVCGNTSEHYREHSDELRAAFGR